MKETIIKISGSPDKLKSMVLSTGKAIVEIDSLDNDYTHTCLVGEFIVVEPSRPPISATRRYIAWYKDRLIYCKIMRSRSNLKWNILGIGEVNVNDILFWCNAKKTSRNILSK